MNQPDFPALYPSADRLSIESQSHFFFALKVHLTVLVLAAVLSITSIPHWSITVLQLLSLLSALACSIYLFSKRPDRSWYLARAVAESIKTITWRYVCRAEPFQQDDSAAELEFGATLKAIVDQNRDVAQALTAHLEGPQITGAMSAMRRRTLDERKATYSAKRVENQLAWYASKARRNGHNSPYSSGS